MRRSMLLAAVVLAVSLVAGPVAQAQAANIVEIASSQKQFSTLVSLVKKAGLVDALSSGQLTVFAPTNKAFNKLPRSTFRKVQRDPALLKSILTYHVVDGAVPASTVVTLNGKSVKTLNGKSVKIRIKGKKVYVNKSRVTKTDIKADNGIIHVIDRVLIP